MKGEEEMKNRMLKRKEQKRASERTIARTRTKRKQKMKGEEEMKNRMLQRKEEKRSV